MLEEFRDLGTGVRFGVTRQHGRPNGSSGVADLRYGAVWTCADGLVERVTVNGSLRNALAEAERLAKERE
jgi:hypothetical protein